MILKSALDISNSIEEDRQNMYELVKNKGISHSEVIKISQQLDRKIAMLQKIIYELHPCHQKTLLIPHRNSSEDWSLECG
ncbi:aspartyl-phosphate phosphatase Spo0E family protein [Priestia abyssalis]|uniref:aspartyl-phosphate phosphatase Spo0E family protein n=1 Tax=Priestia abyssalis TaxID=1221450 RepID=UPI000995AAAD|nr:aspartyl-phosphate phosphatase Spo0E family protein [Priestia abyssalis]